MKLSQDANGIPLLHLADSWVWLASVMILAFVSVYTRKPSTDRSFSAARIRAVFLQGIQPANGEISTKILADPARVRTGPGFS